MKTRTISYTRTMQVRQYEPLQLSATAELGEQDDPQVAFAQLADQVNDALDEALALLRAPQGRGIAPGREDLPFS